MDSPGASRSSEGELFENSDTASKTVSPPPSPVDPTLTALEIQAGKSMSVEEPAFPAAAMGAMPTARRLSRASFAAGNSESHSSGNRLPPKLMLTAAMLNPALSSITRSSPAIQSLVKERMQF